MSAPISVRQRNFHTRGIGGAPPIPGTRRPLTAASPAQARGWKDFADSARRIEGIPAVVPAFDHRLPELRGCDARTDTPAPVPFPAASTTSPVGRSCCCGIRLTRRPSGAIEGPQGQEQTDKHRIGLTLIGTSDLQERREPALIGKDRQDPQRTHNPSAVGSSPTRPTSSGL